MRFRLLADLVVLLHGAFILFVVAGAAVVWRWPRLAPLHLGCAAWGAWIELTGGLCPLTPLENHFRRLAGQSGYEGGFIAHYLIPLIYPSGLDARTQVVLGVAVIVINFVAYAILWRRRRRTA